MAVAYLAALVGTAGYGIASVLQAKSAGLGGGLRVLGRPAYLAGIACDLVAWVASLVALSRLSLFTVQSLLAGSVAVAALLGWAVLGVRLRSRDLIAVAVVVVALGGVSGAFESSPAAPPPEWFTPALLALLVLVCAAVAAGYRAAGATVMALLAGVAFTGAAVCARAVGELPAHVLVARPDAWAVPVYGIAGSVAYARALEHGRIGPVTALTWVVEVVLGGLLGVAALGDAARPGLGWLAALAICGAVLGCVVLSTRTREEAPEVALSPRG